MIINLKQTEIELALRAYVQAQGISLHGKDLSISFTAGRKEAGISAEISIDDVEIPGFTDSLDADVVCSAPAPVVQLVPAIAAAVEAEDVPPVQAEELVNVPAEPEVVAEAKQTVSLFGS